jgi:hypothetical protein
MPSTIQLLTSRQVDKLNLEINGLRTHNRWAPYLQFIPLLTALVAAAGFIWGVQKFQKEQATQQEQTIKEQQRDRTSRELEYRIRLHNQIRTDIDDVLRFTHDKDQTPSRVSFLLEDLSAIMATPINEKEKAADVFAQYKLSFTGNLVDLIAEDVDFMRSPQDVRVAALALEKWDDYGSYLKGHLRRLNFLLYKYIRALRYLRDKNPLYFEEMKYDEKTDEYLIPPSYEKKEGEEQLFEHFSDLRDGFKDHIKLIATDSSTEAQAIRNRNLRQFQAALCNPTISKHILNEYFPEEPCEN